MTTETTGFVLAGRYRLERRIGGTKTRVWSARDELLLRTVAVKILDGPLPPHFVTATQALAKLAHPNIVIINDVGESNSSLYVVMEMLDGPDLAARLRDGPLPWREAARLCGEVAAALGAAHYSGMFHGDLRPENIIMTDDRIKVCGFGSASHDALDRYAPPEGAPSLAGDVYALGMILSEALMGRIGVNVALPADVPDDVARLCVRSVNADPAARPAATELAHELAAAAVATPDPPADEGLTLILEAPPPPPPRRRRRPLLLAGVLATVLASSAAGVLAIVPADSVSGQVKMPSMDNMLPMTTPTASPPAPVAAPTPRRSATRPPVIDRTPSRPRASATDQPVTLPGKISPAGVLNQLQRAIDAGVAAGEIRDDVGLDLDNQVTAMRKTKQADLPAKAAAFQSKVATRLREGALTRRQAGILTGIAGELE